MRPLILLAVCAACVGMAVSNSRLTVDNLTRGEESALRPASDLHGALVQADAPHVKPWHPCHITTYGTLPHSKKRYDMHTRTSTGEVYRDNGLTCAAPVARDAHGKVKRTKSGGYATSIPYGTLIEVRYKSRSIVLRVNDVCVGGTVDVTAYAMKHLLGRYEDTRLPGDWRVK